MLKAYIMHFETDLADAEFNALSSLITAEKRARIQKFYYHIDAQRALLGDVLARYAICENFNVRNADLDFTANPYGKPLVSDRLDIAYNISHTGRYVVCAISNRDVGIDVELIRPIEMKIAERFFCADEIEYMHKQPDKSKTVAFYQLWTCKESYIKMMGHGLSLPLNSFSVFDEEKARRVYFSKLIHNDEAICHTCSPLADAPRCQTVDIKTLIERLIPCPPS